MSFCPGLAGSTLKSRPFSLCDTHKDIHMGEHTHTPHTHTQCCVLDCCLYRYTEDWQLLGTSTTSEGEQPHSTRGRCDSTTQHTRSGVTQPHSTRVRCDSTTQHQGQV